MGLFTDDRIILNVKTGGRVNIRSGHTGNLVDFGNFQPMPHYDRFELDVKKLLKVIGKETIRSKIKRLKKGIGADGKKFRRISDEYLKEKQKRGLSRRHHMRFSGAFLNSFKIKKMHHQKESGWATVTVGVAASQKKKAEGLLGMGYYWKGVSKESRAAIARKIQKTNNLMMKNAGVASHARGIY